MARTSTQRFFQARVQASPLELPEAQHESPLKADLRPDDRAVLEQLYEQQLAFVAKWRYPMAAVMTAVAASLLALFWLAQAFGTGLWTLAAVLFLHWATVVAAGSLSIAWLGPRYPSERSISIALAASSLLPALWACATGRELWLPPIFVCGVGSIEAWLVFDEIRAVPRRRSASGRATAGARDSEWVSLLAGGALAGWLGGLALKHLP